MNDSNREDRRQMAEQQLEAILLEAIDSGSPIEVTSEYWEQKKAALIARHQARTSRGHATPLQQP
jgi:hypothetical protein